MRKALLLATLAVALTADVARAAPSAPASPYGPAIVALFGIEPPWLFGPDGTGVGVGGRVEIPIVDKVIKPIRFANQIVIEGGLDFRHISYSYAGISYSQNIVRPQAGALWNFWFTPEFAAYGTIRTGWNIAASSSYHSTVGGVVVARERSVDLYFDSGVGVIYQVNRVVSLRGELTGWGLQGGVGFRF